MNKEIVTEISIADIQIKDRLRETNPDKVLLLKNSIGALGLMQPILVSKLKNSTINYNLVAGAHRLAACVALEMENIHVKVVTGTKKELLEYQIMENLARNDLEVSDRAIFVTELKEIWDQSERFSGRGGDRRSEDYKSIVHVDDWSEIMAAETGWSVGTLKRSYRIGKILTPEMREVLRGSDMLNNQKQLEELTKFSTDIRLDVAKLIVDGQAKSVRGAHSMATGKADKLPAEIEPQDKLLTDLIKAWDRASMATRHKFVAHIEDHING